MPSNFIDTIRLVRVAAGRAPRRLGKHAEAGVEPRSEARSWVGRGGQRRPADLAIHPYTIHNIFKPEMFHGVSSYALYSFGVELIF